MGGVFDDAQPTALREIQKIVHIAGISRVVDWHHCLRLRRDAALHVGEIHQESVRSDVTSDRSSTCLRDGLKGGYESQGGNNHLVAVSNARRIEGEMES